jgi:hypothetical protein
VLDDTGLPLHSVLVSIKDHSEFGMTESRVDGVFDIAVNGGGDYVVEFDGGESRLPIQRTIMVPWQEYALLDGNRSRDDPRSSARDRGAVTPPRCQAV